MSQGSSTPQAAARCVGVIGLGAMGAGMAQSLRRAGHHVHVHDIRPEAARAFAAEGGTACATLADMAAACSTIVSVVVNAQQTEAVLFGEGGIAPALQPGSVFVMCAAKETLRAFAANAKQ
jgi:3-hydroxyisobutyrate dehydrogenase